MRLAGVVRVPAVHSRRFNALRCSPASKSFAAESVAIQAGAGSLRNTESRRARAQFPAIAGGEKYELAGRYVMLVEPGDFVPTFACGGDVDFQAWYFTPGMMRRAVELEGMPPKVAAVRIRFYQVR